MGESDQGKSRKDIKDKPDQFMFQTILQHWMIKVLRQYVELALNMTLGELDNLLRSKYQVSINENLINVYTLAALGYSQITYAKEKGMLDECSFEASDYGFEVSIIGSGIFDTKGIFKSNKEYSDYYAKLDARIKELCEGKINSSLDKFILRYVRNALAHSEFEILRSNVFLFKGNIKTIKSDSGIGKLSYEILIRDIQFDNFINKLLDQAYGFDAEK